MSIEDLNGKILEINPSNLGNRENLEIALAAANNSNQISWSVINTVAEVLCHTLHSQKDLLLADRAERIFRLIKEGLIRLTVPRNILSKANLSPSDTFKLTPAGAERIKQAAQTAYADVSETIVGHAESSGEDNKSEMAQYYIQVLKDQGKKGALRDNQFYRNELENLFKSK